MRRCNGCVFRGRRSKRKASIQDKGTSYMPAPSSFVGSGCSGCAVRSLGSAGKKARIGTGLAASKAHIRAGVWRPRRVGDETHRRVGHAIVRGRTAGRKKQIAGAIVFHAGSSKEGGECRRRKGILRARAQKRRRRLLSNEGTSSMRSIRRRTISHIQVVVFHAGWKHHSTCFYRCYR